MLRGAIRAQRALFNIGRTDKVISGDATKKDVFGGRDLHFTNLKRGLVEQGARGGKGRSQIVPVDPLYRFTQFKIT